MVRRTAGCATPSRRASPSPAAPICCANRPRWPSTMASRGRPTSPRTAARWPTVAEQFPEASDYLDVYDRAGGLGPKALFAHAIHLSQHEVERMVDARLGVAHCPVSNMFISQRRHAARALPGCRPACRVSAPTSPAPPSSRSSRRCAPASSSRIAALVRCWRTARVVPQPARVAAPRHAGRAEALGLDRRHRLARGRQGGGPHRRGSGAGAGHPRPPSPTTSRRSSAAHLPGAPGMVRSAWVRGRRLPMDEAPPA